jgi:uncharacterized membrane protein
VTDTPTAKRPFVLAIWLLIAGLLGVWAAFTLTVEKFEAYANPTKKASCDISVFVNCSVNLKSAEGSVFGFPNPLMGIAGWAAVIVVAVSLLAGARFPKWYWAVFNLGILFALGLVIFLMHATFFHLGTLCIYCLITWAVTIPTFWAVTLRNLATLPRPGRFTRFARAAYGWVPILTLVSYLIVAAVGQVQLDLIGKLL